MEPFGRTEAPLNTSVLGAPEMASLAIRRELYHFVIYSEKGE